MNATELAVFWLRSQASDLRAAAANARRAYTPSTKLGQRCERVASAYERAAALLSDEATAIENEVL